MMVGRELQRDWLRQGLRAVAADHSFFAVLRGEAGLGKTAILNELVSEAREQGFAVLVAEPGEADQTRPFGAVGDALGVSASSPDSRLVELASRLYGQPRWSGRLENVPVEIHELVDDLVDSLRSICRSRPTLLAVENLHWVDAASLMFIHRLLSDSSGLAVFVVLTARPNDRPEVTAVIESARESGAQLVDLEPLDPDVVCRLAEQVLGAPAGQFLSRHLVKTSGNPLFVIELLRALVERDQIYIEDGTAEIRQGTETATIDATILHRFRFLPVETLELLRMAAIIGRVIDLDELALFTGQAFSQLAAPLRTATQGGLVDVQGTELRFRHELIHDALYHDWPQPVRKALHKDLARLLIGEGASPHRIAHHLSSGAEIGDRDAVTWLHRVGIETAPRAPIVAVDLLKRAAELARVDDTRRVSVWVDLMVALVWSGQLEEAEHFGREVLTRSRNGDLRDRAACWLTTTWVGQGRMKEARELCAEALDAGVESTQTSIRLRLNDAIAQFVLGVDVDAPKRMEGLLEESRQLGDASVRSRCLTGLMMVEANRGQLSLADAYGDESVSDAEALPPADMVLAPAHTCYAWVLEEQDRLDEALSVLERLSRLSELLPRSTGSVFAGYSVARIHFATGRWDDAGSGLESGVLWQESGASAWSDWLTFRAQIAVHRGDIALAREDVAKVERALGSGGSCSAIDYYLLSQAFVSICEGMVEKAVEILKAAWQIAEDLPLAMAKPNVGPHLARYAIAVGDSDTAHLVAESLRQLADLNPGLTRLEMSARWASGLARCDPDHLLEAADLARNGKRPLLRGFVCEDASAALAATGSLDQARDLLNEAIGHYGALHASQRIAAARSRLRLLGVRAGTRSRARRRSDTGWDSLTDSELRIVGFVSDRLSNGEIAERLHLSRRTVETHVSHALAKLGLSSRNELWTAAPPG